jgi:hypothetical protein
MIRQLLSLTIAAVLAAVVGAQGPKALLPQQRAEFFKKNRSVIEHLVEKTVESSKTPNDYVKQANTYYQVLFDFNKEISEARRVNDDARAEELTAHLTTLLQDGLMPTLKQARLQVEGGTGEEEYLKVKAELMAQLNALLGTMDDKPAARQSLDDARARLNEITGSKKK